MSKLTCNLCHFDVDGIAFRTACSHFYCPKCAKQTFQNSSLCAICAFSLTERCVKEVTVGISMPSDVFSSSLFQNVLQSTTWENIRANIQRAQMGYQEVTDFVMNQLVLSSVQSLQQRNELERMCDSQTTELNNANRRLLEQDFQREDLVSSYDQKLRESNRALAEIQEAYKEKLRKCQAWEKAYNNVRSQLSGGKVSAERTLGDEAASMQRDEGGALQSSALTIQPDPRHNLQSVRGADPTAFRDVLHHRMPPEVTPQQALGPRSDAVYPSWRQQGASWFPALRQQPLPFPQQQQQLQMGSADSLNSSMVPYEQQQQQQRSAPPMTSRAHHANSSGFSAPPLALYSTAGSRPSHREQEAFASPAPWPALSVAQPQQPTQRHPHQHQQSVGQVGQHATSISPSAATTSARPTAKRSFFDKN